MLNLSSIVTTLRASDNMMDVAKAEAVMHAVRRRWVPPLHRSCAPWTSTTSTTSDDVGAVFCGVMNGECVFSSSAPQLCPSFFALPAVFLMKGKDALAYCRQLLFEQRLISAWESASRISIVAAFVAWQLYPKHEMSGTARLEAERERWRQEVEYERATSLERNRRDQRQIEQVQARLDASEGVVAQLRSDNQALQELASVLQKLDLGGELEQLRVEREQRAAANEGSGAGGGIALAS